MTKEVLEASLATVEIPETSIEPSDGWLDIRMAEIWRYRELLYFLVWRDLKIRYKQTAVGVGWVIIQPFLTMMIFSLFFGRLARMPSNGLPYPLFYYSALLPWTYFATALSNSTQTLVEHQKVITKVYFPRILLPISGVLSGIVDLAISFVLLAGMMLYYHVKPGWAILLLPLFSLLAIATALAVGLWLAMLNAIYRDVRYILPFLVQFWMFASPVAYPSSLIPAKWRWLYGLNPMAGVIEGFRWSLTGQGDPPGALVLASAGAVALLLVGGVFYFQKLEANIADRV